MQRQNLHKFSASDGNFAAHAHCTHTQRIKAKYDTIMAIDDPWLIKYFCGNSISRIDPIDVSCAMERSYLHNNHANWESQLDQRRQQPANINDNNNDGKKPIRADDDQELRNWNSILSSSGMTSLRMEYRRRRWTECEWVRSPVLVEMLRNFNNLIWLIFYRKSRWEFPFN